MNDPKEIIRNAVRLNYQAMESRHTVGLIQTKKSTVVVATKKRSVKPGARKWDRQ